MKKVFFDQFFDDNSQIPEMLTFVKNVSYASFKYLQFCIYVIFTKLTERGEILIFRFLERISSLHLTKHGDLRNLQLTIEKGFINAQ